MYWMTYIQIIGLCLIMAIGLHRAKGSLDIKGIKHIEDNVRQAVISCYAIEGQYPPNVEYLKDNYGLRFNTSLYQIHYEIFSSNIYPAITVIRKKWGTNHE